VGTRVLAFASQKREFFAEPPVSELPSAFGSNANLILRRFARRASFEATSAPANAKRTPIGVLFALYKGDEKDIFLFCNKVSNSHEG